MTVSFIIPTIGRPSLARAVASIEVWPGDEILIQSARAGERWGNAARQRGMDAATCDYLAFLDDDNAYVPGHRLLMDCAIREGASLRPVLFRIQYPSGRVLWTKRRVKNGNVDTQMILAPRCEPMLHHWRSQQRFADFHFINQWKWHATTDIKWCDEVIALMSHEDVKFKGRAA